MCPALAAPGASGAPEKAFVEPFWLAPRLAANDAIDEKRPPNCVLALCGISLTERARFGLVGRAVTHNCRADTFELQYLTHIKPLKAGQELVWQGDAWVRESTKKRPKAVVLRGSSAP